MSRNVHFLDIIYHPNIYLNMFLSSTFIEMERKLAKRKRWLLFLIVACIIIIISGHWIAWKAEKGTELQIHIKHQLHNFSDRKHKGIREIQPWWLAALQPNNLFKQRSNLEYIIIIMNFCKTVILPFLWCETLLWDSLK